MSDAPNHQPGGSPEGQFIGSPASAGSLLRDARQRSGMSLDELAAATKIAQPALEALERDDFSRLGQAVYARGYLRKIAKALGADDAAIVTAYDARVGPAQSVLPQKMMLARGTGGDSGRNGSSGGGKRWIALIVLVVLGVLFYLWMTKGPQTGNTAPGLPAPMQPLPMPELPPADTQPQAPGNLPGPDSALPMSAPPAEAVPADLAPASPPAGTAPAEPPSGFSPAVPVTPAGPAGGGATPAPPANPAPPAAPQASLPRAQLTPTALPQDPRAEGPDAELTLSFSDNSWVQVRDSRNKVLLNGHVSAGRTHSMSGAPPYAVSLGRAQAVRVQFASQPIDLAPYVAANGSARFLVPAPVASP